MTTETATRFRGLLLSAALAVVPGTGVAQGAEPGTSLPVWELGFGAVARTGSDYPGADRYGGSIDPIPYFVYRGSFLELGGEQALRLIPVRTDRFELGLSVDSSRRVTDRVGQFGNVLEDLDAQFEIGPEVIFRLSDRARLPFNRRPGRLELLVQTRAVFGLDDGLDYVGTVVRPALRYRQYGLLRPGSRVQASIGPIFATEGVQDAYYQVEMGMGPPGYDASGGYLGTEARASMRYPLNERTNLVAGVSMTYLGGATNATSPLMRSDWDAGLFIGLTYSLFQSRARTTRQR